MQTKDEQLTRRDFLKAATVSGLGLSAITMLGSGCRARPIPTPIEEGTPKPTSTAAATEEPTKAPTPTEATEEETPRPTSAAEAPQVLPGGNVLVEWLGHGIFKFESPGGKVVLLGPWLSTNPKCPAEYRTMEWFSKVDLVLFTHGHVDHFMLPDTQDIVERFNPKIIAPWELEFFIIEFENGFKVYHSGDTGLMADMELIIGNFYEPDLAILPIGGVFTMGPQEAAYACRLIRPRYAIPEHYGTFPVLVQTAEDFVRWVEQYAPDTEAFELTPGESIEMPPGVG